MYACVVCAGVAGASTCATLRRLCMLRACAALAPAIGLHLQSRNLRDMTHGQKRDPCTGILALQELDTNDACLDEVRVAHLNHNQGHTRGGGQPGIAPIQCQHGKAHLHTLRRKQAAAARKRMHSREIKDPGMFGSPAPAGRWEGEAFRQSVGVLTPILNASAVGSQEFRQDPGCWCWLDPPPQG